MKPKVKKKKKEEKKLSRNLVNSVNESRFEDQLVRHRGMIVVLERRKGNRRRRFVLVFQFSI